MSYYYILDGHTPVPIDDLMNWGHWFSTADRTVARDKIGDTVISTVFMGADHNWGSKPPLLFETMIFNGRHDGYQKRCATWEQAEAQHAEALELVHKRRSKASWVIEFCFRYMGRAISAARPSSRR